MENTCFLSWTITQERNAGLHNHDAREYTDSRVSSIATHISICHSFLDSPEKVYFLSWTSIEERRAMALKRANAENVQVHPVKIQEYIVLSWTIIQDDRVPFVGRKLPPLRFYDFSLQILFQEMEIGHL